MDIVELEGKTLPQLYTIAKDLNIPNPKQLKKHDLVFRILEVQTEKSGHMFAKGILEILPEGYGFLRTGGYPHAKMSMSLKPRSAALTCKMVI